MARKILLADDSVTAQNMGRKILTDAGYEVVTVNNGSAALKKMAESKPDLIVLDVYMPGYSGLEVCQRIKENRETSGIPVLLTVGKLEPFKPEEARRARADAFVVKPFEASELLSALTKLEDRIIPQPEPSKQGHFAKAASVEQEVDKEKFGDSDGGWRARLRIPSVLKPHDSEPSPDYAATQGKVFRDFIEKPSTKDQPKSTPTNGALDRPLSHGVPNDITPEEIAAIAAAAARLSGAPPALEASGQEGSRSDVDTGVVETPNAEDIEEAAPVTFASSPSISASPSNEISTPADAIPAVEIAGLAQVGTSPVTAEDAPAAAHRLDAVRDTSAHAAEDQPGTGKSSVPVPQEPDPAASSAAEATSSIPREIASEPTIEAAASVTESAPVVEAVAEPAMPVPSAVDDEVMAALQTLMPSSAGDSTHSQPQYEREGSAVEVLAGAADSGRPQTNGTGPRWIAEEVATTADENSLSLEEEMVRDNPAHKAPWPGLATAANTSSQAASDPTLEVPEVAATQPADQDTTFAMASAAAAGEAASVPWTPSNVSAVHERPAIESPAMLPENALDTEMAGGPPAAFDTDSEIVGGTEIMAANWKNIRDSIAGAPAKPAPSKEDFQETVKPEPATAIPTTERGSPAATDPRAIASIVDSVLAELRPKIVEEIARKLADPKKN